MGLVFVGVFVLVEIFGIIIIKGWFLIGFDLYVYLVYIICWVYFVFYLVLLVVN